MRRTTILLLLVGLLAATVPAADAGRPKKPKGRVQTYYIVPGAERFECSLSLDPATAEPGSSCGDDNDGITQPYLGQEPTAIPAVDGLPLTIDADRTILGKITVRSASLFSNVGQLGAGQPRLSARVIGTANGEELVVGETTTETYTVTPLQEDYVVEFSIDPDDAVTGVTFEGLTLELEITGNSALHDGFPGNGAPTLTLPIAR